RNGPGGFGSPVSMQVSTWSRTGRWALVGSGVTDLSGDTPVESYMGATSNEVLFGIDDAWFASGTETGNLTVLLLEPYVHDAGLGAMAGLPISASPSGKLALRVDLTQRELRVVDPAAGSGSLRTIDTTAGTLDTYGW